MLITHKFLGTKIGTAKCLCFVLYEDYIEQQSAVAKDLDLAFERLARKFGDSGMVVRAFQGDIEAAMSDVREKNWSEDQIEQIEQTPGLLLINVDFDEFQPNTHPWVLFSLGKRNQGSYEAMAQAKHWFARLAQLVTESDTDLFAEAAILQRDISASDAVKVFEIKPGIFGLSIDLLAGAALVKKYFLSQAGRSMS